MLVQDWGILLRGSLHPIYATLSTDCQPMPLLYHNQIGFEHVENTDLRPPLRTRRPLLKATVTVLFHS